MELDQEMENYQTIDMLQLPPHTLQRYRERWQIEVPVNTDSVSMHQQLLNIDDLSQNSQSSQSQQNQLQQQQGYSTRQSRNSATDPFSQSNITRASQLSQSIAAVDGLGSGYNYYDDNDYDLDAYHPSMPQSRISAPQPGTKQHFDLAQACSQHFNQMETSEKEVLPWFVYNMRNKNRALKLSQWEREQQITSRQQQEHNNSYHHH